MQASTTGKSKGRYEKVRHLGEGQFANVYLAKDTETNELVAIKKIKLGSRDDIRDGINRTALREIKLLQELNHPNIICLRDVFGQQKNIQLVMDFMETDLEVVIKDKDIVFMLSHIKNIMLQLLLGMEYLHQNWVLHRDLKPNNLLVNSKGRVKITDFGLARVYGSPNRRYTSQVITLWYRPPELLYGAHNYSGSIDTWSIGCILAELLLRNAIFPGASEIDQLCKIYDILGTPTKETWPLSELLPGFINPDFKPPMDLAAIFSVASPDLLELIKGLFLFDPIERWGCSKSLQSAYFKSQPFACPDREVPLPRKVTDPTYKQTRRVRNEGNLSSRRVLNFDM
uniref:Cyclin-dependent kinase 7 n=1 Tax=Rhabditophanes sp. KR3021 TaxID=114890 RepID=A0AC35UGD6_9BILA